MLQQKKTLVVKILKIKLKIFRILIQMFKYPGPLVPFSSSLPNLKITARLLCK